jgi:predicted nucleic acid-binding protein
MTTALDTNAIVALWHKDASVNSGARTALESAFRRGALIISPPVFSELIAAPGRSEGFVRAFLEETGIGIDWEMDESIWSTAGNAFQSYATRRRKQGDVAPRRILADFLIGAHAVVRGHRLLTLDERMLRASFPTLVVITF